MTTDNKPKQNRKWTSFIHTFRSTDLIWITGGIMIGGIRRHARKVNP